MTGKMPSADTEAPSPRYIQTDQDVRHFFGEIAGLPLLALDTEAASFHKFHDRVYLIQLSTRSTTAVIDPLPVTELGPLGTLLADPAVELVFHDADYDLRLLHRDYGFRASNIFDTRIAAQLLNEPGVGLAALLEKHLGVRLDKRFQRADWSRRPLSADMLAYAAMDTSYLPSLRDILRERLREATRLAWAQEEFRRLETLRWTPPDDTEGFWRVKGSRQLRGHQTAVLREVYRWREDLARRQDRAAFRVLSNDALLALAREQPQTPSALGAIKGIGADTVSRRGKELLQAVRAGLETPEAEVPKLVRGRRPAPDPALQERLERLKVARNALAQQVDLAPGVLCPNGTLEAIARAEPHSMEELAAVPELRQWQAAVTGPALLRALTGV